MSILVFALVFCSACLHVGWNLLCKSQRPTGAFFLAANTVSLILLAPHLVATASLLPRVPPRV